ncbi:hypothetical protein N9K77_00350 [bacterium]|nr:hypothetical protein [bacterium]
MNTWPSRSISGVFENDNVISRFMGDFPLPPKEEINLIDVGANQIASIAASCIPFLEHDDANMNFPQMNLFKTLMKNTKRLLGMLAFTFN